MTTLPVPKKSANWVSMKVWKVAGALHSPKVITQDSKRPRGVLNAILYLSPSCIQILLYPQWTSSLVKNCAPRSLSMSSGINGIGAAFFLVIAFKGVTVRSLCLSVVLILEFSDRCISQIGSRPDISIRKLS